MKTTLNPFENAKRTANGTGGFSPSVIEEMQAEISVLGSENASQAQDITDINDNLTTLDNYTKANKLESKTNIGGYNSFANRYTFPGDGYLELGSTGTNACIYGSNATSDSDTRVTIQTPANTIISLFVRKGMSAYIVQSGKTIYYYPLS